jgi:hypothetical protein
MWSYEEARARFVQDLEDWRAGVRTLAATAEAEAVSTDMDLRKVERIRHATHDYSASGHELLSKGEWLGQWLCSEKKAAAPQRAQLTATIAEIESSLDELDTILARMQR